MIPTRDRWPLLSAHSVPSALGQDDVDLELVVVDDGSTDGTSAKLADWRDSRLRVLRHERPRGVAGARNAGVAVARGSWIAFLDDDDLWSPRKLRAQLDVASEKQADIVYAAAVLVDESRSVLAADVFPDASELPRALLDSNVIPGGCSNVLVRAALVRAVGGFDESLTYTEDWDLWVRLMQAGTVAACREVLVAHVDHRGNALFRYRPDVLFEVEHVLLKHRPGLDASTLRARRLGALDWMAHEYARGGFRFEAARIHVRLARERRRSKDLGRAIIVLSGPTAERVIRRLRRRGARSGPEVSVPSTPEWLEQRGTPGSR